MELDMRPFLLFVLLCIPTLSHADQHGTARLSVQEYYDKVSAAWLGQIVGNIYGLSYEFQFLDQPGPDRFPYGFGASLERVQKVINCWNSSENYRVSAELVTAVFW